MTATHYLIFLGCLLACDIVALYSYFFYCEAKHFNQVYNTETPVEMRLVFPIQCVVFTLAVGAFYALSSDKTVFDATRFGLFAAATGVVTLFELVPVSKRSFEVVRWCVELGVMSAVVFMLPDNPVFEYFDLPAPIADPTDFLQRHNATEQITERRDHKHQNSQKHVNPQQRDQSRRGDEQ